MEPKEDFFAKLGADIALPKQVIVDEKKGSSRRDLCSEL